MKIEDEDNRTLVTFEWTLPRDHHDFWMATHGADMYSALWDIDQKCRTAVKHGDDDAVADFADQIRDLIRANVSLDEVP